MVAATFAVFGTVGPKKSICVGTCSYVTDCYSHFVLKRLITTHVNVPVIYQEIARRFMFASVIDL